LNSISLSTGFDIGEFCSEKMASHNINTFSDILQIDFKSKILLNINSLDIIMDEVVLDFVKRYLINQPKSQHLINIETSEKTLQAVSQPIILKKPHAVLNVHKSLDLFEKISIIIQKNTFKIEFQIISCNLGFRFHDREDLNLHDSLDTVLYLSISNFKLELNAVDKLIDLKSSGCFSASYESIALNELFVSSKKNPVKLFSIDDFQLLLKIKKEEPPSLLFRTPLIYVNLFPLVKQESTDSFSMMVKLASLIPVTKVKNVNEDGAFKVLAFDFDISIVEIRISLISETKPHHCLETVIKNVSVSIIKDKMLCFIDELLISTISEWENQACAQAGKLLKLEKISMMKDETEILKVSANRVVMKLSISRLYVSISSVLFSIKIFKLFSSPKHSSAKKSIVDVEISIPNIIFELTLPTDVIVMIDMQKFALKGSIFRELTGSFKTIVFDSFIPHLTRENNCFTRFLTINDIRISATDTSAGEFSFVAKKLIAVVSASDPFYNVAENAILLNKAVYFQIH
jgi:hypothetical protein